MREVLECYGKFALDSMVVLALMTLLFVSMTDENGNKGLYSIIGAQIEFDDVDYRGYTDFKETYKNESEKSPPSILFEGHRLEVGVHVLSNYIKAVDDAGNGLAVKVKSILAPDNVEVLETYNPDTGEIYMSQTGVYTITVIAIDDRNKFTEAMIQIPINQRKRSI